MAVCNDGSVVAWGRNHYLQLADGTATDRSAPVLVDPDGPLSAKTVVSVEVGNTQNLARCSDGTLAAWGLNFCGVSGRGFLDPD